MAGFDPTRELSDHDALVLIREIIEVGDTIWTPHVLERMRERGYSDQDVLNVLECGLVQGREFDSEKQNWKYRVEGKDIEGEDGVVITAVVWSNRQVIITVF